MKHEEFLKQVKERDAAFKVYGTDGCRRCDTGRITLFVKREVCEQCDGFSPVPTTYGHSDVLKLLAIIELLESQRDDAITREWMEHEYENARITYEAELDDIVGLE